MPTDWGTNCSAHTDDVRCRCSLLQPRLPQASKAEEEPSAYAAPASDRKRYHYEEEDDGAASTALMQSQKLQMEEQDDQLDLLGASISRQHHLSLQMNEELEQQWVPLMQISSSLAEYACELTEAICLENSTKESMGQHYVSGVRATSWSVFVGPREIMVSCSSQVECTRVDMLS